MVVGGEWGVGGGRVSSVCKMKQKILYYKANEAKIMQDDTYIYTELENSWQRADM